MSDPYWEKIGKEAEKARIRQMMRTSMLGMNEFTAAKRKEKLRRQKRKKDELRKVR